MRPFVRLPVLLGLAGLLLIPAAAQQLYRSVGPDGRVQYSDRPPADGTKAEKVTGSRVSPLPSATGGDAAKAGGSRSVAEQEQEFRKRRLDAEEKARKDEKLAEEKRSRTEACAGMRRQVSGLQSGARVVRTNERGENIYLEDPQVQQEVARLERDIAAHCN